MSMSTTPSPPPAQELFRVVFPLPGSPTVTDSQADKAVKRFLAHLVALESKHVPKPLSDQYLASQVFGRSRAFKNDVERAAYCRCHLKIALRQFRLLTNEFHDPAVNSITMARLMPWKDIVVDYIFDLLDVVPFLERKTPGYVFFMGGKNAGVHSWQVYVLSRSLAYQSVYQGQLPQFDHKAAQIAAIFVLRQSLELRFERLIGVYPEDKKGKRPRLKHGFHQDFIGAYPNHFQCHGFSIVDMQPVYDWCSEIVHLAYQPYAWQMAWALEICGQLLGSRSVPAGQHWNIANAVEVVNVSDMQSTFEAYFLKNYDHGSWRMTRTQPEALVRNWMPEMAITSPDFRPVERRRSWIESLVNILSRCRLKR
jgi:hypothetical protein